MLLAASLANDEEGTNHCTRRGMQSPRHPWTDWAWGCPWSTLFSQVFNLFSHTPERKVNKDPFFLCGLHFITCLPKTDTSSKFVWTAWRYQSYFSSMPWGPASGERALCLLSSSKPTRIWGQLQHCPLDAKDPDQGQDVWPSCLLGFYKSSPISEKTLIQRCFQSHHLGFLFRPSIKIESYPLLFDVTAFQFRLLKHFMDLVWVLSTAFPLLLPMDKQAYKS